MIATIDETAMINIAEKIGTDQKILDGLKTERESILCFIHAELKQPADKIKPASVLFYAHELEKNGHQIERQKAVIEAEQDIVDRFGVIFG